VSQPRRCVVTADRIWDGIESISRPDRAVIIRDGHIETVVDRATAPADLPWFEFGGCTVLPGLIDAHVHLAPWMLPTFLAAGVTTVRDLGNDLPSVLSWRKLVSEHPTFGPRIFCTGPLLDGSVAHWPLIGREHRTPAAIQRSVAELASAGVDAVKLYAHLDGPRLAAAVDAAHRHGLTAVAHLGDATVAQAATAGVDEIEHFSGCQAAWQQSETADLAELASTLRSAEIAMCPTLVVWDRLGRPFDTALTRDRLLDWVPDDVRTTWRHNAYRYRGASARLDLQASVVNMKRCLDHVHGAGVPVLAGSDTPFPYLVPGFSLHDELALMVDAGLRAVDVLRSATSVSAAALGAAGTVGALVEGAHADLLAVHGDPLADIAAIGQVAAVFKAGSRLSSAGLRRRSVRLHREQQPAPIDRSLREWADLARAATGTDWGRHGHG